MKVNFKDYKQFVVTGVTVRGKRFKMSYTADYQGCFTAFGINLYRGSVWGVLHTGKRKLLNRVWN